MTSNNASNMGSKERPLTPYSRDPSPSSSGTTMAAPLADWPLASDAGDAVVDRAATERPKSRLSHTAQNGHRIPMMRGREAIKSHLVPSFHFPRTASLHGQAHGESTSLGAEDGTIRLQIPAPSVRPPTRHGLKRSLPSAGSSNSDATGSNVPFGQTAREDSSKRIKHGLATQISRGAQVFSSAGSFFPFKSEEPAKTRISAPFGFRHVARAEHGGGPMGGTDHGPDADPEATLNQTHRVLLDVRTNSRLENRTSLPVAMPNVTSPIDETQFDAGCGHDSSHYSFNPFHSQSQTMTPATLQIHRPANPPVTSGKRTFSLPKLHVSEYLKRPVGPWNIAFWTAIMSAQITIISTAAAIALMVQHSNDHEVIPGNMAMGLALSVVFCFTSMAAIAVTYARRRAAQVMQTHQYSQKEEELIEMRNIIRHSTPTRIRRSDPAIDLEDMTQRRTVETAGQNERSLRSSGGITTPEQVHIHQSSRIVAEGLHNLAAPPNSTQSKRKGGIYDSASVCTALVAQSIIKGQPFGASGQAVTTPIGVARSESLLRSAVPNHGDSHYGESQRQASASDSIERADDRNRSHSTESNTTQATYESMGTETPMISDSHVTTSTVPGPSREKENSAGGIPHSVAVPDLSSENKMPPLPSAETQSTLSSLITSYAGGSETDLVNNNAPRRSEALSSHPVQRAANTNNPFKRLQEQHKLPHQIVTEAGTPESQKSIERFPSYVDSNGPAPSENREALQALQGLRAPMTPIVERSESPIVERSKSPLAMANCF